MIAAVILAAGRSTRMGRPKALLPHPQHGRSFLEHLIRAARSAGLSPVFAAVRGDARIVAEEAARCGGTPVVNPDPDGGQLSSIVAALDAADASGADGVLILPVDVPLISASVITAVLRAAGDAHVHVARAGYRGVHGHPVLFKRAVFDELRAADPAVGARAVVRADPARLREVDLDDPGVTIDVDTPADYERLVRDFASGGNGPLL